jgi:hypothetical protein
LLRAAQAISVPACAASALRPRANNPVIVLLVLSVVGAMFLLLGILLQSAASSRSSFFASLVAFNSHGFAFSVTPVQTTPPLSRKRRVAMPPNYAFKPTARGVFRNNPPLQAGGGLTRRWAA